jgi:hypothetical protein
MYPLLQKKKRGSSPPLVSHRISPRNSFKLSSNTLVSLLALALISLLALALVSRPRCHQKSSAFASAHYRHSRLSPRRLLHRHQPYPNITARTVLRKVSRCHSIFILYRLKSLTSKVIDISFYCYYSFIPFASSLFYLPFGLHRLLVRP